MHKTCNLTDLLFVVLLKVFASTNAGILVNSTLSPYHKKRERERENNNSVFIKVYAALLSIFLMEEHFLSFFFFPFSGIL